MRNQIVALKNESDRMVSVGIPVSVLILLCRYSVDNQVSAVITVQPSDNIQKCRFSGTARSEDRDKFIVS